MSPTVIHSHKDLIVWQKAIVLVSMIYDITADFPKEELYGLTSQIRKSAISIPSNIAEGRGRGTKNEYLQFLRTAYGSGAELETQIALAQRLPKTKGLQYGNIESLLQEVMKMLYAMIRTLNPRYQETRKG